MIYILDLLNKIKWDKREIQEFYTIHYHDRTENINKTVKYTDIMAFDPPFMIIEINKKLTYIPIHRIKEVKNQGKTVWKRE
ncbi:MAG TPA: DUF504 domain-containing protein [Candidatus Nanoarchaeia archaeon]|nr:DUF504 domain-containing protein [Candidatus Nanoarchaeia archaeon]